MKLTRVLFCKIEMSYRCSTDFDNMLSMVSLPLLIRQVGNITKLLVVIIIPVLPHFDLIFAQSSLRI